MGDETQAREIAAEIGGGRKAALLILHARGGMKWWRLRDAVEDRMAGTPSENVDLSSDPLFEFYHVMGDINEDIAGLSPLGKAVAERLVGNVPPQAASESGNVQE